MNLILEEAGLLFQSKFQYYKASAEYRYYYQFAQEWVLALRILGGFMNTLGGSRATPVEERFYAGGSYSVRGWERQELGPRRTDPGTGRRIPIGGNSKLVGGAEVRYPIYRRLTGALLQDFGNVWEKWNGFDLLSLKYSLGLGLRYKTPIGPVRLDVARKINKQFSEEDDYKIHISIGHAF
jgi:outer membrane protein insertion porin family